VPLIGILGLLSLKSIDHLSDRDTWRALLFHAMHTLEDAFRHSRHR
jgi:hypothetical protein